eukprot:gnl/TRDRNA2_/TRDRNA2_127413_c0_seq1.p1 gnl/TRDRNA2_/TRDRNA2_127413_c0~~gnl/TRDRNA2_/TRDRNA2_127413_c0_seq1.p1  ORF type:complete len:227 (+),score=36.44 gnl/TRDRNA2_/TRDRNA2_127413_c0_seq1:3-683(+)
MVGMRCNELPENLQAEVFCLAGVCGAGGSPRPMLLELRTVIDKLLDWNDFYHQKDTTVVLFMRRWHRLIDSELVLMIQRFDNLSILLEEQTPNQFRWVISMLIFVYAASYPWCVPDESAAILGSTTLGMALIFYGINALTHELEDPTGDHGQGFNLSNVFRRAFREMEHDELVRRQCEMFVQKGSPFCENVRDEFVAEQLRSINGCAHEDLKSASLSESCNNCQSI